MSHPFFTPERAGQLRGIMDRYRGTPFAANGLAVGPRGGISCQMLAAQIMREAGLQTPDPPAVAMVHWKFSSRSIVEEYMRSRPEFERLDDAPPAVGDLFGFILGRCLHHVGIYAGNNEFFHVMSRGTANYSSLYDPTWSTRRAALWRPIYA